MTCRELDRTGLGVFAGVWNTVCYKKWAAKRLPFFFKNVGRETTEGTRANLALGAVSRARWWCTVKATPLSCMFKKVNRLYKSAGNQV